MTKLLYRYKAVVHGALTAKVRDFIADEVEWRISVSY